MHRNKTLFDHLVGGGGGEQRRWRGEPKNPGGRGMTNSNLLACATGTSAVNYD